MTSCPICGIPWPTPVSCCPCGFAPAAMDEFVIRLRIERRRGLARQALGAGLCGLIVPFALLTNLAWIATAPLFAVFAVGGIIVFMRGTQAVSRTTLRLRAAKQIRQLPAARVVSS